MENTNRRLSEAAVNEFRDIYKEEFGEELTDGVAEQRAMEVLRLFAMLAKPDPEPVKITLSEQEFKALKYIHRCLVHEKRQPTVRGIAEAIGKSSSRSGFKMLHNLGKRGLIWRQDDEVICIHDNWCEILECSKAVARV